MPAGAKILAIGAFENTSRSQYNPDLDSEIVWGEQSRQEVFMSCTRGKMLTRTDLTKNSPL